MLRPVLCVALAMSGIWLLISVAQWNCSSCTYGSDGGSVGALAPSLAPCFEPIPCSFFLTSELYFSMLCSATVRSSSLLWPMSFLADGLTHGGGTGSTSITNHSGRLCFGLRPSAATSESGILSSTALTSAAPSTSFWSFPVRGTSAAAGFRPSSSDTPENSMSNVTVMNLSLDFDILDGCSAPHPCGFWFPHRLVAALFVCAAYAASNLLCPLILIAPAMSGWSGLTSSRLHRQHTHRSTFLTISWNAMLNTGTASSMCPGCPVQSCTFPWHVAQRRECSVVPIRASNRPSGTGSSPWYDSGLVTSTTDRRRICCGDIVQNCIDRIGDIAESYDRLLNPDMAPKIVL